LLGAGGRLKLCTARQYEAGGDPRARPWAPAEQDPVGPLASREVRLDVKIDRAPRKLNSLLKALSQRNLLMRPLGRNPSSTVRTPLFGSPRRNAIAHPDAHTPPVQSQLGQRARRGGARVVASLRARPRQDHSPAGPCLPRLDHDVTSDGVMSH